MKFNADEYEGFKVTRKKPKRFWANTMFTCLIALLALPLMLPCGQDNTSNFVVWFIIFVPLMVWGKHKDDKRAEEYNDEH